MQEIIVSVVLAIVIIIALGLLFIVGRKQGGMTQEQRNVLIRILIASGILLGLQYIPASAFSGLDTSLFPSAGRWARFCLYLVDYFIIGYDILLEALEGIRNREVFDENFLMAVATVGAMALAIYENGDYVEAIAVMLFYQVGEWFQSYAIERSRRNISDLMDIRPDYANVERNGSLAQVDPNEVAVGSVIVVQPGEKIPIDGVVLEGCSTLNTSALTGESLPREVEVSDTVISGCINMTGVLKVRTTKEFGQSTASKILNLVESASSKKSRSEDFISRFARVYTPVVCCSALALAILPPLVQILFLGLPAAWIVWAYRALVFLVISCPCALVISIPLSFFAGIGGASREGILVKGSNYLEALSQTKVVVLDKTGTLTQGSFEVDSIYCSTIEKSLLLEYAALAESASSHPISKSLLRAYGKKPDRARVGHIQEFSGNGVLAKVDGLDIAVGNDKLMARMNIACALCEQAGTVVHVAVDGIYAGYLLISDQVKPHAKEAIAALKTVGVNKTVMLTGDNKQASEQVAAALCLDHVHSELLPADKVTKVEELLEQTSGKAKLVFVGDGINDAPVLSRADVGIAMGAMGSDAAIEAADVVLMDDDPMKIAKAIRISKKCLGIVYQNIVFALGVKFICLTLGAFGIANMYLAIFADVGVMVLAVLNAIRCLFVHKL
ncbi:MAG: cadmium-translocating P-type ATPase [Ruminiclostridium sp.]|nr:cadmium-translocating P-type ATPase [Ruminiclostridium sp.]